MVFGSRAALALVAVVASGCAAFGDRDVTDCDAVRVVFEDTLAHLPGAQWLPAGDDERLDERVDERRQVDAEALRGTVALHEARRECFGQEADDFLGPARELLDGAERDFLQPPVAEQPVPVLGDPSPSTDQSD